MKISEVIKQKRLAHHLTQEDMANEFFVSRQLISKWENGKSYPDLEQVIQLGDFFDITIDELIKGDKQMVKTVKSAMKTKKYLMLLCVIILVLIINSFVSTLPITASSENLHISRIEAVRDDKYNGDETFRDWNTLITADVVSKNPFLKPIDRSLLLRSQDGVLSIFPTAQYSFSIFNLLSAWVPTSTTSSVLIDNKIANKDIHMNINDKNMPIKVY